MRVVARHGLSAAVYRANGVLDAGELQVSSSRVGLELLSRDLRYCWCAVWRAGLETACIHMIRSTCTGLALVATALACRGGESTILRPTRTDSAGVEIVENQADDRPLQWSLDPVLRLGGQDVGPEMFFRVARPLVSVDRAGNIFLLDPSGFSVTKFTPQGEPLFTAGREGGGPGEFKRPLSVAAWRDGGVAVLDRGRGSSGGTVIRFGANGSLLHELPVGRIDARILPLGSGLVQQDGQYLEDGYQDALQFIRGSDSVELAATSVSEIRSYRFSSCGGSGVGITGFVIFAPRMIWHGTQSILVVNSEPGYVVDFYDSDGILTRSVRRRTEPRLATADVAEEWVRANPRRITRMTADGPQECIFDPDEVVEKQGYASYVPEIADVTVAPDGSLWVERYQVGEERQRVDVFDPTGAYVGTVPPGFPLPLHVTAAGHLLVSERDDLDVERLVVAKVQRQPLQ